MHKILQSNYHLTLRGVISIIDNYMFNYWFDVQIKNSNVIWITNNVITVQTIKNNAICGLSVHENIINDTKQMCDEFNKLTLILVTPSGSTTEGVHFPIPFRNGPYP